VSDVLALAQSLIRCESVTPKEAGTLDVLENMLKPLGFVCSRHAFHRPETAPVENLFAKWGSGAPHFCFAGHVDVVPVGDASAWTHPPFGADIVDGILYGRGASDMKTGVAAFVTAAEKFICTAPPKGSISLLITCDEEGPSVNGKEPLLKLLHEKGERFEACLVGEPTSAGQFGDTVKIGRRGSLHGYLTILGKQGHVAYPDRADNPVPRLLRTLSALKEKVLDEGNGDFQPSNLEITTVDIGNPAANVIPAKAFARFNVRFNTEHTGESLSQKLREICSRHAGAHELRFETGAEPFLTSPGPLSTSVTRAIQAVTGHAPALSTAGGTSDARFISRYCPVTEFGLLNHTAHHVDEHVAVADVLALEKVYHRILEEFFGAG